MLESRLLTVRQFFFFDAVGHVIASSVSSERNCFTLSTSMLSNNTVFLIASELSIFKNYFSQYWPLLSPTSGLVFLGVSMVTLGVAIMGNLNKQATGPESLGLPFWRIVISSGILVGLLGFMNIIAVCSAPCCNRFKRIPTHENPELCFSGY
jgi:nucleoside recognition membrane protein YjiH